MTPRELDDLRKGRKEHFSLSPSFSFFVTANPTI